MKKNIRTNDASCFALWLISQTNNCDPCVAIAAVSWLRYSVWREKCFSPSDCRSIFEIQFGSEKFTVWIEMFGFGSINITGAAKFVAVLISSYRGGGSDWIHHRLLFIWIAWKRSSVDCEWSSSGDIEIEDRLRVSGEYAMRGAAASKTLLEKSM